jgi:hypothetical protein
LLPPIDVDLTLIPEVNRGEGAVLLVVLGKELGEHVVEGGLVDHDTIVVAMENRDVR